MDISVEPALPEVISLLESSGLPVADIRPAPPIQFFGIHVDGKLVAVVGLELQATVGLLRSLAVAPAFRGRGFGREMVGFAESVAASQGVETLFLLTTTAERFFQTLGYRPAVRSEAPPAIQATSQFTSLCPAAAEFLSKQISQSH